MGNPRFGAMTPHRLSVCRCEGLECFIVWVACAPSQQRPSQVQKSTAYCDPCCVIRSTARICRATVAAPS